MCKAFFNAGTLPVFDYRDIREKGAELITTGGQAPGPEPLRICVERLTALLRNAVGRRLEPIEAHDMACIIADAVLAGGIRRAAMISLFDRTDEAMLTCKSGEWYISHPERARANNSAVLPRGEVTEQEFLALMKRIEDSGCGEPGVYWTNNKDWGTNPCCLPGDTLVQTTEGLKSISSLIGTPFIAELHGSPYPSKEGFWYTGDKVTYTLKTDSGMSVRATGDHRILTKDRGWVEMLDLSVGEYVQVSKGASKQYTQVVSVETFGIEPVYDCTIEEAHAFVANGIVVHNCEIALRPYQMCNLTEINAGAISSQRDYNEAAEAASFIGTLQAGYTDFHYLNPKWRIACEKDALLGVSMTGIASGTIEKLDMEWAATCVIEKNQEVAAKIGINPAARTNCVKPAGTTSLVLGTSSGIHAWHAPYYIRRMRAGKDEALAKYMAKAAPALVEQDVNVAHQVVLSFPQKAPEGATVRTEPMLNLLERVKNVSSKWVSAGHVDGINRHNVSCTISVKDDEWDALGKWMWINREYYNGISVLPYFGAAAYPQLPFEDIDEDTYLTMLPHLEAVDISKVFEDDGSAIDLASELACSGGACEITF